MTKEEVRKILEAGGKVCFGYETYTAYEYSCPHDGYPDGYKWEYEHIVECLDDLEFTCNGDWNKLEVMT